MHTTVGSEVVLCAELAGFRAIVHTASRDSDGDDSRAPDGVNYYLRLVGDHARCETEHSPTRRYCAVIPGAITLKVVLPSVPGSAVEFDYQMPDWNGDINS
jgi:hypothetical protein